MEVPVLAQVQQATVAQVPSAPAQPALRLDIPHSDNPLNTYQSHAGAAAESRELIADRFSD